MDRRVRIGEFLVGIGAMTSDQLEKVLAMQHSGDARLFGEIAVALGFVNKSAIKKYFNMQS